VLTCANTGSDRACAAAVRASRDFVHQMFVQSFVGSTAATFTVVALLGRASLSVTLSTVRQGHPRRTDAGAGDIKSRGKVATSPRTNVMSPPNSRSALIVAHPGHELRVHAWLEQARPTTFVLTQGDGASGMSRLRSTTGILARAGARPGAVYGPLKDREIYAALLERRYDVFLRILDSLVDALIAAHVNCIVSDAEERYNPSHDVCRYLASAAASVAARAAGRDMEGFDFPLIGPPDACAAELSPRARWIHLDDAALARKLTAAHSYPELAGEVDAALATVGAQAFRTECLRPWTSPGVEDGARPFYEVYGERQVAAGVYAEVIRLEHLLSLRDALWRHADVEV
jgi:hypothetical protein